MSSYLLDPAWKSWYKAKHEVRYYCNSGEEFEEYITSVLRREYDDFLNPSPMGQGGDGGCDGLAKSGRILFACYGQRAQSRQDQKTKDKLIHDFERALDVWPSFEEWQFITNASFGPQPVKVLLEFQRDHEAGSDRPIRIRVIKDSDMFWDEHVSRLDQGSLDTLFPGAPHAQSAELEEIVDLINELHDFQILDSTPAELKPVSNKKMSYNQLSWANICELNEGRISSPRIDNWFNSQPNPELRDETANTFNRIYLNAKSETDRPSEILSRIYIAIAGSDFSLDSGRANAAYALAAYFFDTCDIFESVPEEES